MWPSSQQLPMRQCPGGHLLARLSVAISRRSPQPNASYETGVLLHGPSAALRSETCSLGSQQKAPLAAPTRARRRARPPQPGQHPARSALAKRERAHLHGGPTVDAKGRRAVHERAHFATFTKLCCQSPNITGEGLERLSTSPQPCHDPAGRSPSQDDGSDGAIGGAGHQKCLICTSRHGCHNTQRENVALAIDEERGTSWHEFTDGNTGVARGNRSNRTIEEQHQLPLRAYRSPS
mmetsp:Transcript_28660/g.95110  ORF Transcript_28660/g.95110 Transcript_28660/m.95110 type:complete len:236 (+) Transcript_28660:625-1332(+)